MVAYRATHNPLYARELANKDTGQTLYVDSVWKCVYKNNDEKLDIRVIQDCLRSLNIILRGANTDELNKVPGPENPRYNFKGYIGVPNIQVLPLDASDLSVEYIYYTGSLDESSPVSSAANTFGVVNGVLNVYIGDNNNGILGQAELSSNILFALFSAVGGYNVKGKLSGYNLGKTLAHEFGHSCGLYHAFDGICDGYSATMEDELDQKYPNYDAMLYYNQSGGYWDIKNDNRYNDYHNGTMTSCLHLYDAQTAKFENPMCIMDYGSDGISFFFTKEQSFFMRDDLMNRNSKLKLVDANHKSISSGGTAKVGTVGGTSGGSLSFSSDKGGVNGSGLSVGLVTGLAVLGGVIMILVIYFFVSYYRRSRVNGKSHAETLGRPHHNSSFKSIQPYEWGGKSLEMLSRPVDGVGA